MRSLFIVHLFSNIFSFSFYMCIYTERITQHFSHSQKQVFLCACLFIQKKNSSKHVLQQQEQTCIHYILRDFKREKIEMTVITYNKISNFSLKKLILFTQFITWLQNIICFEFPLQVECIIQ